MGGTNTHAIERAKERYGLDVTQADLNGLAQAIAEGASLLVRRDGGRLPLREEHVLSLRGVAVRVVYQPLSQKIVTFLPRAGGLPKARRAKVGKVRNRLDRRQLEEIRGGIYDV